MLPNVTKPAEERPTGRDIIQGEDKMKMCLKYRLRGSKVNSTGLESKQRPGLVLTVFTIQYSAAAPTVL